MACLLGVPQFLGLCGVREGRPLRRLGFRVWVLGKEVWEGRPLRRLGFRVWVLGKEVWEGRPFRRLAKESSARVRI